MARRSMTEIAPGRRTASEAARRVGTMVRPIAAVLRVRAIAAAPSGEQLPWVHDHDLVAGAATQLWNDARAVATILEEAYAQESMQISRDMASLDARARNDACVPLTHWVCDGLAELDAITTLLGWTRAWFWVWEAAW